MAASEFKSASGDSSSYYDFENAKNYLRGLKFDMQQLTQRMLENPEQELQTSRTVVVEGVERRFPENPVFQSPVHKGMVRVIKGAKEKLYINVMLFGGSWGLELVRQGLLRGIAAEKEGRDFQFILMHDMDNVFVFKPEMEPMWEELRKASLSGPYSKFFSVLESDISKRRTSAFPMGLDKITGPLDNVMEADLSLRGTSDHSKVVIADPFSNEAAMMVQSKNITDFNHTNFDEGLFIQGPFVGVAMHAFEKDISFALQLAEQKEETNPALVSRVQNWIDSIREAVSPNSSVRVAGQGESDVRVAENNADDSVRNTEHTLLKLINGANKNIRIYNMLAYHNNIARALADASKRLSPHNVRIMLDATLTYPLNMLFLTMLRTQLNFRPASPREEAKLEQVKVNSEGSSVRWRKFLAPVYQKDAGFIDVEPQQHTKTVIIDDKILLLGSANFDVNTMKGAFREFSVAVRGPEVARASAEIFDSLWKGTATVDTAEIQKMKLAEGKKPIPDELRFPLVKGMQLEADRNNSLNPRNFDKGCDNL